MTGEQFQEAQRALGYSVPKMARELGVTPLTVTRWRQGHVRVPVTVQIILKLWQKGFFA